MSRRSEKPQSPDVERMRLDKWLWAARFFKTRQLAIDAINSGKVHIGGLRAKPGKDIEVGVKLSVTREQDTWNVTVLGLCGQRRPATEAALLYQESQDSIDQREAEAQRRRDERGTGVISDARPNKRDRRLIHRFKRSDA
ncbi:MAG: RNA-binding S4 domain-containing protein [Methylococcaceae bacterium]|jgi:ribosome-associated heat shock protein Hsp15